MPSSILFDPSSHLYWYAASCPDDDAVYPTKVRVYDGDTCRLNWHLGDGIVRMRVVFRLWGISAPEIRGPDRSIAEIVRDRLRDLIVDRELMIQTLKDSRDNLGSRYLAKIYSKIGDEWVFVNERLIEDFPENVKRYIP